MPAAIAPKKRRAGSRWCWAALITSRSPGDPSPLGEQPRGDAAHGIVEFGEGPALGVSDRRLGVGDEDQSGLVRGIARGPREAVAGHVEPRRGRVASAGAGHHPACSPASSQSGTWLMPCTVQPPSTTSVWPVT